MRKPYIWPFSLASIMWLAAASSVHAQIPNEGGKAQSAAVAIDTRSANQQKAIQDELWKAQYGDAPSREEIDTFLQSKPEALKPLYRNAYLHGEWNAVLNLERLGLRAMELQLWDEAARAFDLALDRIESVYGKTQDKAAARAQSKFRKEANKDFIGEAYERAMAYYYRGLLYLREGDYENARVVFNSAELQDAESDDESKRSDFAVLNYLAGWSSHCLGQKDKAAEAFQYAKNAAPGLSLPQASDTILVVGEIGIGPIKVRSGKYNEKMIFQPVTDPVQGISFQFGKISMVAEEAANLYYQASTRGSRQVDAILDGKASFKSTTSNIGQAGMMAGLQMMNNYDQRNAGMAVAAAGALFSLLSKAAKPEADVRMWDGLPERIMIKPLNLKTLVLPQVQLLGDGVKGNPPAVLAMGQKGKCALIWARAYPTGYAASPERENAPGIDKKLLRARLSDKKSRAYDDQFRAQLRGE